MGTSYLIRVANEHEVMFAVCFGNFPSSDPRDFKKKKSWHSTFKFYFYLHFKNICIPASICHDYLFIRPINKVRSGGSRSVARSFSQLARSSLGTSEPNCWVELRIQDQIKTFRRYASPDWCRLLESRGRTVTSIYFKEYLGTRRPFTRGLKMPRPRFNANKVYP